MVLAMSTAAIVVLLMMIRDTFSVRPEHVNAMYLVVLMLLYTLMII